MYTLKKSLGQHFLKDENISRKIVDALIETKPVQLLEIGPGGGALTKYLLKIPGVDFKAVELDNEKIEYLLNLLPDLKGKLIHDSFLDLAKPFNGSFTVIGNFPYNISSQIVFRVIEWRENVECMIGMFQKEVALRITAKPGSKMYGILSVLTQVYFKSEYLFEVGENSFKPPPKVKSAVIKLTPIGEQVEFSNQESFFFWLKQLLIRGEKH